MARRYLLSSVLPTGIAVLTITVLLALNCNAESTFDEGVASYRQNKLKEALPLFKQAVRDNPRSSNAHAYLAETLRRMKRIDEAVEAARKATLINSCNTFGLTVLASAYCPMYSSWEGTNADSSWSYLLKAVMCDPLDGNIWTGVWSEAMRRGNRSLENKALRTFIETKFLTSSLLNYNAWVLRDLPQNAVLLTNGDMDTYPTLALQLVRNLRPDVGIVNLSLLNLPWYARIVRDRYKIPLPFTDKKLESVKPSKANGGRMVTVSKKIVAGWLDMQKDGKFPRPLTVAATVGDRDFTPDSHSRMRLAGPFYTCLPKSTEMLNDTTAIRISLGRIAPNDFSGSFVSRNDRSPVRLNTTNRLASNITATALLHARLLLESGQASEAYKWAEWAEHFEAKTKAGPVFAEQIEELKDSARKKMK